MSMHTIDAFVYRTRDNEQGYQVALFHASAENVLKWCRIDHLDSRLDVHDDDVKETRIQAIEQFLETSDFNFVAPSVVISLDPNTVTIRDEDTKTSSPSSLRRIIIEVPEDGSVPRKPGHIIDGRYRLLGIRRFNASLPVSVVAILNEAPSEAAFHRAVIESKHGKDFSVRSKQLSDVGQSERLYSLRIPVDGNYWKIAALDPRSPFFGLTESASGALSTGFVSANTLERAIQSIKSRKISVLRDDDSLMSFFFAIWTPIKSQWPELWHERSRLFHVSGMIAITRFITDALIAKYDFGELDLNNVDSLTEAVNERLAMLEPKFWSEEWSVPMTNSGSLRELIYEALECMLRNSLYSETWNKRLSLLTT